MEHRMILVSADFREVHRVVVAKKKASVVQPAEPLIRNQQIAVRDCTDAPVEEIQWGE